MKFILVIGTGRSGSTTLQRIINTIPKACICGENKGYIFSLLEAYSNLNEVHKQQKHTESALKKTSSNNEIQANYTNIINYNVYPGSYNSMNAKALQLKIKEMIVASFKIDNQTEIIGFKEICLYNRFNLLDTFLSIFPDSKIILNIRNDVNSQSVSKWYKNNPNSKMNLINTNAQFINYNNAHKDTTFLLTFEDMFKVDHVKEMFKFLNQELNEDEYQYILDNKLDF